MKPWWIPAMFLLNGCYLLTPEDPPHEPKELTQEDFAWDNMDITIKYEFIDIARIDCPKLESNLKASGKCTPKAFPLGAGIECPLVFPARHLDFACFKGEDAPMIYARLEWDDRAKNIDFSGVLGPCDLVSDGPLAGKNQRYPTDPGYKACLFRDTPTRGTLRGAENALRPAGMFIDLARNSASEDELQKFLNLQIIDAPAAFVLDAAFLNEEERVQALRDVTTIFKYYRRFLAPPTME